MAAIFSLFFVHFDGFYKNAFDNYSEVQHFYLRKNTINQIKQKNRKYFVQD